MSIASNCCGTPNAEGVWYRRLDGISIQGNVVCNAAGGAGIVAGDGVKQAAAVVLATNNLSVLVVRVISSVSECE